MLTPVQKVACSNHVRVTSGVFLVDHEGHLNTIINAYYHLVSPLLNPRDNSTQALTEVTSFTLPDIDYIMTSLSLLEAWLGGATVARLTPVQKVVCSNLIRVTLGGFHNRP